MESYQQYNKKSGSATYVEAEFTWDKAYRIGSLQYKNTAGTNLLDMDHSYDADGNLASRDVTGSSVMKDAYYTYDGLDRVTYDCGAATCSDAQEKSTLAFNVSGDRTSIRHDNGNSYVGDMTYLSNYTSGTGKLSTVTYDDGSPRTINYAFDARGNRLYDDDTQWTRDKRDYTYDARNNLITVEGKFTFDQDNDIVHDYTLTNAYDHKNRRVFKSFYDETDDTEAQWFFYYDFADRLFEIKHTPNTASSSTYSLYQFYYIGDRPVAYWQVDYPSATTTKRYINSDDQNRPNQVYSWSNSTTLQWQIRADLYGWDGYLVPNTAFMPLRFPGQYADDETMAVKLHWGVWLDEARPPLSCNWHRTYDPFTGGYLQVDPKVDDTWDAYRYAGQNPAMRTDPTGLDWTGNDVWDAIWCGIHWPLWLAAGAFVVANCVAEPNPAGCAFALFTYSILSADMHEAGCFDAFIDGAPCEGEECMLDREISEILWDPRDIPGKETILCAIPNSGAGNCVEAPGFDRSVYMNSALAPGNTIEPPTIGDQKRGPRRNFAGGERHAIP